MDSSAQFSGRPIGQVDPRWVTLAVLLLTSACTSDEPESPHATYTNPEYGYTISYPDSLDLREYIPEYVAIGNAAGDAFDAEVEVVVERGEGEEFEAIAIERARASCAADGPGRSLYCAEVLDWQPFSTAAGDRGHLFYLRHLMTRPGTNEVLEEGERGPFIVFELPATTPDAPHRMLFVRAPVVLPPEAVRMDLVRAVAQSLHLPD